MTLLYLFLRIAFHLTTVRASPSEIAKHQVEEGTELLHMNKTATESAYRKTSPFLLVKEDLQAELA